MSYGAGCLRDFRSLWGASLYSRRIQSLAQQFWVKVKVTQSCLTLCDLMDETVHGILQARILEWVAFPFSSREPRMKPRSPALQADSLPAEPPGEAHSTSEGSRKKCQLVPVVWYSHLYPQTFLNPCQVSLFYLSDSSLFIYLSVFGSAW